MSTLLLDQGHPIFKSSYLLEYELNLRRWFTGHTPLTLSRAKKEDVSWHARIVYTQISLAPSYKTFSMLNSAEREILNDHKYKYIKKFSFYQAQISLKCYSWFLLINVKMPTTAGILTFMSRKKFMLMPDRLCVPSKVSVAIERKITYETPHNTTKPTH